MTELYPDFPTEDTPQEVVEAYERWEEEVPEEQKREEALLYFLLGTGTYDVKLPKEVVDYIHEPQGNQKCGNCKFAYLSLETKKLICSQIEGKIDYNAWCRLWEGIDD